MPSQTESHVAEKDILLISIDGEAHVFARVDGCEPDILRGDGWYRLTILALFVPPRRSTWVLRGEHLDGEEFVMEGRRVTITRIDGEEPDDTVEETEAVIVNLIEWRKRNE